ncbi:uncharacterized protein LOC117123421 [Anneissia japonica]|uniref:uncharacterized protein LOC117123421 n=1 Tax=Anneissia japonica TaxID=1529436 RepID=UPI0014259BEA|nr:uncharacterized protein LOC117123421 [Anneissia japonica]
MEPSEIKVIVHGARNLKVRKSRRGKCKASVVFGIGDERYQTSEIKDCNPDWNEESIFSIIRSDQQLVLTVKDKEDVIGSVCVPLEDISNSSNKRRMSLGPYKKRPSLGGELIFDCWVTGYSKAIPSIMLEHTDGEEMMEVQQTSGRRLDTFLKHMSPKISRKYKEQMNNNRQFSLRRCNSTPFQIDQLGKDEKKEYGDNLIVQTTNTESVSEEEEKVRKSKIHVKLRKTFDHSKLAQSWEKRRSVLKEPRITDVFPWTAHTGGGTKITISGENFGWRKSDIASLKFCDVECKENMMLISTKKLECCPPPALPKDGHVVIETIYGSKVQSTTVCQYADLDNPFEDLRNPFEIEGNTTEHGSIGKNSHNRILGMLSKKLTKIEKADEENSELFAKLDEKDKTITDLQCQVDSLKKTVEVLTTQKAGMQRYIDCLVAKVMEVCPEALENCDIH